MVQCCIIGCKSNSRKKDHGLSLFKFPKNESLHILWKENIGIKNIKPVKVIRVCSQHFEERYINRTLDIVRLKDNAVPTLFPLAGNYAFRPSTSLPMQADNNVNLTAAELEPNTSRFDHTVSKVALDCQETCSTIVPLSNELRLDVDDTGVEVLQTTSMDLDLISSNTQKPLKFQEYEASQREKRLARKVQLQRMKIKSLNQKCLRLQRKVQTYQGIIHALKEKNLVRKEGSFRRMCRLSQAGRKSLENLL